MKVLALGLASLLALGCMVEAESELGSEADPAVSTVSQELRRRDCTMEKFACEIRNIWDDLIAPCDLYWEMCVDAGGYP